jgi:uncharacterized damage-inducible protein DinB
MILQSCFFLNSLFLINFEFKFKTMRAFFRELYEYNHFMNGSVIRKITEDHIASSEKNVKLMSHILNANRIWNDRINASVRKIGVFDLVPVHEMQYFDKVNFEESFLIIDNHDFEQQLSYVNSKGNSYTNSVRDVMFHVINHSNYHRAQIAADMRANGIDPVVTDFIFYKR